jgi:hypothetical protein
MDVESSYAPSLVIAVVYDDPPDLIERETHIRAGDWSGKATAYASTVTLHEQCSALSVWTHNPVGEVRIEAGADTGIGWLILRFYSIDLPATSRAKLRLRPARVTRIIQSTFLAYPSRYRPSLGSWKYLLANSLGWLRPIAGKPSWSACRFKAVNPGSGSFESSGA